MSDVPGDGQFTAVIFDFNGVLWWDGDLQSASWRAFSERLRSYPLDDSEMALHVHGRNNNHTLGYLLRRPVTGAELADLSEQKEALYREQCLALGDGFRLSPGAVDLLDFLAEMGVPRTIATASAWPNVEFFINHLELERWFAPSAIIFDDGVRPGKPAPDPFLAAAAALGVPTAQCIVVEDSHSGLVAATTAGIGFVVALGPPEAHASLSQVPGVGLVIDHLGRFPRERLAFPAVHLPTEEA